MEKTAHSGISFETFPSWALVLALAAATPVLGAISGSMTRLVFTLACLGIGLHAWRRGPGEHIRAVLLVFAAAPFLRRIVDLGDGFDPQGLMLTGPLLMLLAPLPDIYKRLSEGAPSGPAAGGLLTTACCAGYAVLLTLGQGQWIDAAANAIKWFAPIIYAYALSQRSGDALEVIESATQVFVYILPVTGLYGVYQYIDPPAWDRFWLHNAPITSAGSPEPFMVRVFSTMNGPASFASFTATGLVLVLFLRSDWVSRFVIIPAALALMLSLYRTAWIALAAAIFFSMFFAATSARALILAAVVCAVILLAVAATPFGEVIADRFATFGEGAGDDSLRERLQQYADLWDQPLSNIFGQGFVMTDMRTAGANAIDGTIIAAWSSMGVIAGILCIAALVTATTTAMFRGMLTGERISVVMSALAFGALAQIPLATVTSGELGFLFWTFTTLGLSYGSARA